jgi:hypothetical protein
MSSNRHHRSEPRDPLPESNPTYFARVTRREFIPGMFGDVAGRRRCCLFKLGPDGTIKPLKNGADQPIRARVFNTYAERFGDGCYVPVAKEASGRWVVIGTPECAVAGDAPVGKCEYQATRNEDSGDIEWTLVAGGCEEDDEGCVPPAFEFDGEGDSALTDCEVGGTDQPPGATTTAARTDRLRITAERRLAVNMNGAGRSGIMSKASVVSPIRRSPRRRPRRRSSEDPQPRPPRRQLSAPAPRRPARARAPRATIRGHRRPQRARARPAPRRQPMIPPATASALTRRSAATRQVSARSPIARTCLPTRLTDARPAPWHRIARPAWRHSTRPIAVRGRAIPARAIRTIPTRRRPATALLSSDASMTARGKVDLTRAGHRPIAVIRRRRRTHARAAKASKSRAITAYRELRIPRTAAAFASGEG